MNCEKIAAVIPAAGSSSRMNGIKKEYQKLPAGATVLETAVRAFVPYAKIICIAVSDNNEARNALPCELTCKPQIIFSDGGAARSGSVLNSLRALSPFNPRYVLIHDGARPFVSVSLIENIIAAVKKYGAVIPALPITDTPKEIEIINKEPAAGNLKRSAESPEQVRYIKKHLKRANIGIAQTPQAFLYPEILHAHEKAASADDEEFTDDAEVWSRFCGKVAVIPGDPANRKITFIEDLD